MADLALAHPMDPLLLGNGHVQRTAATGRPRMSKKSFGSHICPLWRCLADRMVTYRVEGSSMNDITLPTALFSQNSSHGVPISPNALVTAGRMSPRSDVRTAASIMSPESPSRGDLGRDLVLVANEAAVKVVMGAVEAGSAERIWSSTVKLLLNESPQSAIEL